jgi:hypothetical protein
MDCGTGNCVGKGLELLHFLRKVLLGQEVGFEQTRRILLRIPSLNNNPVQHR